MSEPAASLEEQARAAYYCQDYDEAIKLYELSYASYRKARDDLGAVRVAGVIGWLYGGYRGDRAVMSGWIARQQRLAEEGVDTLARGWAELYRGIWQTDRAKRDEHLRTALASGRRFADADLESIALAQLGSSLVHEDRIEEGMAFLDEALAAVAGGEVSDFLAFELIFCQLFTACEYACDIGRAEQWMRVGEDIARRHNLPAVAAWCRTHYGGLLTTAGRWEEAEAELKEASRLWSRHFPGVRANALIRLANLRVRQGRLEEAEQLLEGFDSWPEAAWPAAALRLARGEAAIAVEILERALGQTDPDSIGAAPLWALLVDALIAQGSIVEAEQAAGRLKAVADKQADTHVPAVAALARARLGLAVGEADPASILHQAITGFARALMPVEAARARLELARALAGQRPEVAVAEARAAFETFERLGDFRHADETAALLRSLGVRVQRGEKGAGALTRREAEVLQLLGRGLSNPEIADRLFITRKTVEHHVGRILVKLGLRSRAEAAAYAARAER